MSIEHQSHLKSGDSDNVTKNLCTFGLLCSWILGFLALIIGCKYWKVAVSTGGAIPLSSSTVLRELLPLGINIITTILTESMGIVHAQTLRWKIGKRLPFNSNLRLLTKAGKFGIIGPWGVLPNFLHAGFLAVSYCAGSFIFVGYP